MGDVLIGDSGATSYMLCSAALRSNIRSPSPDKSRILQGDGSVKKVPLRGNIDLVFQSAELTWP